MRIVVDNKKCTGCRICEQTCSAFHNRAVNIYRSRIRVTSSETLPNAAETCKHCRIPKCYEACKVDAMAIDEDKIVTVLEDKCVQCYMCVDACPFDMMFIDAVTEYPIKCDLCGGDPRCVKQCPEGALSLK
jgi:Fe-S-cluster-containing hydrogenase component 2